MIMPIIIYNPNKGPYQKGGRRPTIKVLYPNFFFKIEILNQRIRRRELCNIVQWKHILK